MTRIEAIKTFALLAGRVILSTTPVLFQEKEGRQNSVTTADLQSEQLIIDGITTNFPKDVILSEETASTLSHPEQIPHLWIIDPLDGTNNFLHSRNYFCVSIAYARHGEIKIGVVYDPIHNELFFAEKGKGAYINNKRIYVANEQNIHTATVVTDNGYNPDNTKRNLSLFLQIDPPPWLLMRGSAALAYSDIAHGRVDLFFHTSNYPWDNAAGFLLVEEAGGIITNLKGEKTTFLSPEIIAGNKSLVDQFVKIIYSSD